MIGEVQEAYEICGQRRVSSAVLTLDIPFFPHAVVIALQV